MGSNRRRRPRRRHDKAPKPTTSASRSDEEPTPAAGGATPAVHDDVPDHVLELIFLRLDSSVSLVRAASACRRWCRVVADSEFLSRFRLSVPLVLGHYHNYGIPPVFVPSSSPTPGTTTNPSVGQPLSLDFIPRIGGVYWSVWKTVDSRDGLILLRNNRRAPCRSDDPDLLVCEPKARRYHAITMPERLSGPNKQLGWFLLRGGATGIRHGGELSASLSNLKVLVVLLRDHMLAPGRGVPEASVYQLGSSSGKWSWRDMTCAWTGDIHVPNTVWSFYFAGRANGSLYWGVREGSSRDKALVLDEATAGVSLEPLPACMEGWSQEHCFRAVGGQDGAIRAVGFRENVLRVVFRRRLGEWVLEKLVRLPKDVDHEFLIRATVVAADETYALVTLQHSQWVFSVDLKTMAVERVRETKVYSEAPGYPYQLPWPPILKP